MRVIHRLVPVTVVLVAGGLLAVSARHSFRPAKQVTVRPVVFASAGASVQPVNQAGGAVRTATVQAPGWLEADPYHTACTALADGVIESMEVLEGDAVEAGQVVARLVSEDAALEVAREEADLLTAESDLAMAQADLRAAQTDWENPVARDRAVAVWAASLAEIEAELVQLPALINVEVARHEQLLEELKRGRVAQERGAASELEIIITEKKAEAQAATVDALRRRQGILEARRDRHRAEVAAAERDATLRVTERRALDAAQAGVGRAHASVAIARVKLDEAQLRLDRMVIRAPIDGYVQRRLKAPGDKVMLQMDMPTSSHLVWLYDPQRLQVRVDVPLADASNIVVGQACEVVVDVLPDQVFAGEVTRITHEADLQKNTLQVKVRVIDPHPILRPEMLTRVKFIGSDGGASAPSRTSDTGPSVRVAVDCLEQIDESTGRVWTVRDRRDRRGTVQPVEVIIDEVLDGWANVRGDLRPGDLVVVETGRVEAGQRVRVNAEEGGQPS